MTWVAERQTVNQRVQIGAESTSALGTPVAASKLLSCFSWTFGINADVAQYTATGHKYASISEENTEWVDLTVAGDLDHNGVLYLLSSTMGSVAPVAHGASTTAKDWIFTPPIYGSVVPQTYTLQQGDTVRAHQTAYSIFSEFGYKGVRKGPFTVSAKGFAQAISDGITLTSSPTAVSLAPTVAKQWNIYLDSTSAALGTTQLLRVLSIDYAMSNVYGPLYVFNRSNASWTAHVDLMPKVAVKLKMEADANGMTLLNYLQTGVTYYLRVAAQGNVIDNNQTVSLGSPSAGNFTLTYKGQTTANIAYNAASSAVQTALQALSTIGAGNATVAGSAGGPYTVTFAGTLASDTTALTGNGGGLTGGTFLITQTQIYNTFTHDMAVKVGKPSAFSDDQGVFAIEWELVIVEDPAWGSGKAQTITETNLITAL